ncbi:hypothetical protein JV173_03265 [Acholeplasma equirhinis]|uniref:hypothetical protein n=1 Tax=Acholeplasma equirhinis TaxID=555393 RepID=UPI00197AB6AD|nr:hypothetical protein [Acholeplasma equirhinis]MBN3490528.1 hypothetical protein [Acholeplasma equirhinis]
MNKQSNSYLVLSYYKKHWPMLVISLLVFILLNSSTNISYDTTWMSDVNIWLTILFLDLVIFGFMTLVTYKIRNEYLQNSISLIITLTITESIKLSFDFLNIDLIQVGLIFSSFVFIIGIFLMTPDKALKIIHKQNQKDRYENQRLLSEQSDKFLADFANALENQSILFKNNSVLYSLISKLNIKTNVELLEDITNEITKRKNDKMITYIKNNKSITVSNIKVLTAEQIESAVLSFNSAIKQLDQNTKQLEINIFETLGLKNLSGFVGEVFGSMILKVSNGQLVKNLNQDGYPDLLLHITDEQKSYYSGTYTIRDGIKIANSKEIFSPYKHGGIEIKANVGSTPPGTNDIPKLVIGQQRIDYINMFDWKSHHRDTNNLIGITWDFINSLPTITAVFYSNNLTQDDWSKIVQPREGGGRTTSVSLIKKSGRKKMFNNWIVVIDDEKYINKFAKPQWIGERVK